ncbi:MAG TPA: hypothetical protein PK339_12585 [Flavitalea sp.]|nr:hypothetical protein [Flavitalea sp.]
MNEKEMLQKLLQEGREMRHWQKKYFRERNRVPPETRNAMLAESKRAEAKFDSYLFNFQLLIEAQK